MVEFVDVVLTSIIIGLHSVPNFVFTFLLAVELLDSNEVEGVSHQVAFDLHVDWGVAS